MGGSATRQAMLVGLGFGVIGALISLLFPTGVLAPVLNTFVAIATGVGAAYVAGRALAAPVQAQAPPTAPAAQPPTLVALGIRAGVVMGLVTALAVCIVTYGVINSPNFRDMTLTNFEAQLGGRADALLDVALLCVSCFLFLVIPPLTAGLAAAGAWIYGRVRPVPTGPSTWTPPPVPPMPGGPVG